MKKFFLIPFIVLVSLLFMQVNVYAETNKITLNTPEKDIVNHTFKYPNLTIDSSTKPYSLTISIENGYFESSDVSLNAEIGSYYDFKGGTDTTNAYVDALYPDVEYKSISLNSNSTVDLSDETVKAEVISEVQKYLRNILFYSDTSKDAKITISLSELEMKLDGHDVVAFKSTNMYNEHYYVKYTDVTTWSDAYDIAAGLTWNNLQGYLVVITDEEEHNFIYNSLGSIQGWMGAAAITNADSITYNTSSIAWEGASSILDDENYVDYWYWVAGPEAGTKVFGDGKYTKFNDGEPNNHETSEWCAEYGFGEGGRWNDYAVDNGSIQGYYVEFGGFDDDDPDVVPVSYTQTFKWSNYETISNPKTYDGITTWYILSILSTVGIWSALVYRKKADI